MNRDRRNKIKNIIDRLEDIKDILQEVLNDEVAAYDSMPEGLQCGIRGEMSEEAQESMESAIENLDEALEELMFIS